MTPAYVERRVLAILLTAPGRIAETGLKVDDFTFEYHRQIFRAIAEKQTGDILVLGLPDDVSRYAVALDEDYAPTNLCVLADVILDDAKQRDFARSVSRLRGGARKDIEVTR
jgi:hypothetical protein